jgi:hypothetical protein
MNFKNNQEFTSLEIDTLAEMLQCESAIAEYAAENVPGLLNNVEVLKSLVEKLSRFEPVGDQPSVFDDQDFMWQSIYRLEDRLEVLQRRLESIESDLDDGK